jgi:lactoylglutathione lyase
MKTLTSFALLALFAASRAISADAPKRVPQTMNTPSVSLGYVILYVKDVAASLAFYEKAFGLSKRFFHDDAGKAYGELETGATRLAFVSLELAKVSLKKDPITTSPTSTPLASEIALVTPDVQGVYARALKAGATAFAEPSQKPWGQVVSYVRDIDGHMVEICSPLP